jgi:D-xylonolactonase
MSDCTLELIADYACVTGEGPLWHAQERRLYWVDIPAGKLFQYDPVTGRHACVHHDRPIGGYTIQAGGDLLLFRDQGNIVTWRDGSVIDTVIEHVPELRDTRFNDVVADPQGRVFCGSMSSPTLKGRLHRLDRDGSLHVLLENQGTPNGMAFSPDRTVMYYNDSNHAKTWAFDYDQATGALTRQRLFRQVEGTADPGRPDGLTCDAEGFIWTARWAGHAVLRFTSAGELDARFDIPDAANCSSLTFAPRYDALTHTWSQDLIDLYVTTAAAGSREKNGPRAGALFRLRFAGDPYRGQAEYLSRIGW